MTFRFIHSNDLHLGKRFGQFSGDLPTKLCEARHAAIGRLGEHARMQGASTILLAGDAFDTETPRRRCGARHLPRCAIVHRSVGDPAGQP